MNGRIGMLGLALSLALVAACGGGEDSGREQAGGTSGSGGEPDPSKGGAEDETGGTSGTSTGGAGGTGATGELGGSLPSGGTGETGGSDESGGSEPTGGSDGSGGSEPTGGSDESGGSDEPGGSGPNGGSNESGGSTPTGGATPTGGSDEPGGAGSAGAPTRTCSEPVLEHGFVTCDEEWVHRESVETCPSTLPRDVTYCPPVEGGCTADSDCTEQPHGYCESQFGAPCRCSYGCQTDADCGAGYVCLCGDAIGRCLPATCTTDSDCGPGSLCATYDAMLCGAFGGFACLSDADQCTSRADCSPSYLACQLASGARECGPCAVP